MQNYHNFDWDNEPPMTLLDWLEVIIGSIFAVAGLWLFVTLMAAL